MSHEDDQAKSGGTHPAFPITSAHARAYRYAFGGGQPAAPSTGTTPSPSARAWAYATGASANAGSGTGEQTPPHDPAALPRALGELASEPPIETAPADDTSDQE